MKKAVITILGTISPPREGQEKAHYYLSQELQKVFSLKKENYTNMLPLLIANLEDQYGTIRCIYTNFSKNIQSKVLRYENLDFDIRKEGVFISENAVDEHNNEIKEAQYSYFLNQYNALIEEYDKVIIDVSHGFRHFPILAVINLIIQNIKNPQKIEHILFAKEVKQYEEYEIIDLKEYLELANLSSMLSSFNQNYTVSSNIHFSNGLYQELAEELNEFSHHFLSNSLKPLIEGTIIENIISNLEVLQTKESVENFREYIEEIKEHLEEIRQLKYENEWMRLYKLSQMMDERGYQLNAITLLFEAVGLYCLDALSQIEIVGERLKEYRGYIEEQKEPLHIYSLYTMTNQSRVIVKIKERFKVGDSRLFINTEAMKDTIVAYLNGVDGLKKFKRFIEDLEGLRNNLAHGNSGFTIEDVKFIYKRNQKSFEKFAIKENILKDFKSFKGQN
ncbi:MAG: Unknown protein [uncultured Sulfurovum sp.]|uniref:CRISPR-associated protein, TM1812 family n=1 Tax=uncultured Sulfurovum sp. TaxID=269237 RepID=A0A6S6TIP3_9BACT|nr:MAG: Unknown protein [uncultured Sulfurovum sp.]